MLKRVALTRRRRAPRSPQEPCARRRANACWGVRFLEKSKHARPESVGAPQSFARRAPGVSGERSDDVLVRAYRECAASHILVVTDLTILHHGMRVTVSAAVLALGVAQASAFAVLPPASLGTFSQDSAGCVRGAWSRGQRRSSRSLLRVPRLLMCLVQGQRARAGRGRGARDGRVFTVYLQCWECPSVPTRSLLRVLSCSAWEQGSGFPNG